MDAILIAGPTASGKSSLAMRLAERFNGAIVNSDSMQVYGGLRVLTARPDAQAEVQAPHHLYGHVDPSISYSTGAWLRDVHALLERQILGGRLPIFVGGTGLYFKALLGGLSDMPAVPTAIRQRWRDRLAVEGPEALHALLLARDPPVADRLKPHDGQRILRALEILDATGESLASFQASSGRVIFDPSQVRKIILAPDRAWLRTVIATRFEAMMSGGAVAEVEALLSRDLDPALPAMKAIGVREIGGALAGRTTMEEAVSHAVTATRQFAKRQSTWFRNQFGGDWERWENADDVN